MNPGEPVRVLWLTKGLGRGGAERLTVDVALGLDPDRFEVEVAYVLPWKDALVDELVEGGLVVHSLGTRHGALDLRWLVRLRRLLNAGRGIDLVHTHAPVPAVGARLVASRRRTAIIHTEHNVWARYRAATRWANAVTIGRNDLVVAVSRAVADSVRVSTGRRGCPPVEVVVHGVSLCPSEGPDAKAAGRRLLGLDSRAVVIGTVGNLTEKKGQMRLLELMADLTESRPDLHLVIVGDGPLAARLHERAACLGVAERVLFTGSRDDVAALLPAFDVFVLSSEHEGLPIALLEAMSTGVACIATAVGGIPEIIRDGVDGRLVPPLDRPALVAAVIELLDHRALRSSLAAGGQRRVIDFDLGAAVRRTEQLYDQVLAGR